MNLSGGLVNNQFIYLNWKLIHLCFVYIAHLIASPPSGSDQVRACLDLRFFPLLEINFRGKKMKNFKFHSYCFLILFLINHLFI